MSNVGQLASSVFGAAIGFVFGGPAGALYGFQAGLLGGSLLFPTQLPGIQGPRLEDFEALQTDPGAPVWQCFGTVAVPGFPMYLGPRTETSTTEEVGGKGPPGQEVTTFQYFQTIAIGLCEGPIDGIRRIWENGQLVYDPRPQQDGESDEDFEARIEMSEAYAETFTLYLGDEEQEPDPTLELEQGVGNVPAFRGLAYIVFPDRELKQDQGLRHPQFKVEVTSSAAEICSLNPEKLADVDDWTNQVSGGSDWSGLELDEETGIITEQTVDYESPDATHEAEVITVGSDRFFRRRLRTFDTEGNQLDESSALIPTIDNDTRAWVVIPMNSASIMAVRKFGGSQASDLTAWYVNGALANRPILPPPPASSFTGTIGLSSPQLSTMYVVPGVGVYVAAGDNNIKWICRYPGSVSPSGTPDAWYVIDQDSGINSGSVGVIGHDRQGRVYAYKATTAPVTVYRFDPDLTQILDQWPLPNPGGSGYAADSFRVFCGRYLTAAVGRNVRILDLENDLELVLNPAFETLASQAARPLYVGRQHWLYYKNGNELFKIADHVSSVEAGDVPIADIITHVCLRAGLVEDQVDASSLVEDMLPGYALTRPMSARNAIEPLRQVGLFDVIESEGKLKFPKRGGAAVATLTADELGVVEEGQEPVPAVTTTKLQDVELPRQVRLRYLSAELDYEPSEQLSPPRHGTEAVNDVTVEVPVVLQDSRAAELADIVFREAWASRCSYEFSLGPDWYHLEPADVVLLPVDGRLQRVRIGTINDSQLLIRRVSALRDDDGAYVSQAVVSAPRRRSPVVHLLGGTEITLLDLPALREQDDSPGFYLAARRTGTGRTWQGARIHRSLDGGATYSQLLAIGAQAVIGEVVSAPASGDGYTWDNEGAYVVDVLQGTLSSRTDQAVLAGANAAAVGAHGRWHIFQFANAELIAAGRYRLTRLLLGRRGTEHLIDQVEVGDTFVLVSGPGIYRVPLQSSEIGVTRVYRAVTNGAAFSTGDDVSFAGDGQALECFSPVHVRGSRDESGNLTITWLRRDRLAQTLRSGVPLELNEATEAYEVDILDESDNVVRTIDGLTTTQASYSATDQTADFGSPQDSVAIRVYQLSAVVGRGTPVEAIV